MSIYFEKVNKYIDQDLPMPERKTKYSAGYDFASAEDAHVLNGIELCPDCASELTSEILEKYSYKD